MDNYVTGAAIKSLREAKRLTQEELAERIHVSAKAVSEWETGKGFPDISLLEPLAKALDVSVIELLSGEDIRNRNRAFNMLKSVFYVCPACGNVICATGEAVISCCGIVLAPLTPEPTDESHQIRLECVEDEIYVSMDYPMTKEHSISFFAAMSDQGLQIVKLYPEGNAEARLKLSRVGSLWVCCNRHGLFRLTPPRTGNLPPMRNGKECAK
ncbi:MAG: helix-turn-helix domain-containing protein [Clostridia bacterium]|nr:helix-turn-helix domain-containing protein [Clostridia bacterium]